MLFRSALAMMMTNHPVDAYAISPRSPQGDDLVDRYAHRIAKHLINFALYIAIHITHVDLDLQVDL